MSDAERIAGRYTPIERVGSGGMGVVYRARDSKSGGHVAVKVIREDRDDLAARFEREVSLLRRVKHDAVVGYQAHGKTENGRPYLVMDWVEGPTVRSRLDELGLTPSESIAVATQIASALAAAHDAGLVHRDVKPSNIILRDGRIEDAVLIDFGLARMTDTSDGLTLSGVALGTPGYMAPEQALGRKNLDERTDIFALGCVLYECLSGVAPFSGLHRTAVLSKIVLSQPAPLDSLVDAPPDLVSLVSTMLAKRADLRPSSCELVNQRLSALPPIASSVRTRPQAAAQTRTMAETAAGSSVAFVGIAVPPADSSAPLEAAPTDRSICLVDGSRVFVQQHVPGSDSAKPVAEWALETRRRNPTVSISIVAVPAAGDSDNQPLADTVAETAIDRALGAVLGTSLKDAFADTEAAIELDEEAAAHLPKELEATVVGHRILLSERSK